VSNGGVTYRAPARTTFHRTRIRWVRVAGLLLVVAAIAALLGSGSPGSSSSPAPATPPIDVPRAEHPRALGEADGALPDGTTVFDEVPGVARLDPALLGALRSAATDASSDGEELVVDSGWRSPAYQQRLLREAVAKYGSEAEATRWVATPETSAHVSGDAVDIGPSGAAAWLSEYGAAYGLCRIYGNEPWHYELRPEAPAHGCPATYADPTHDPRMQR
jgi:zinc D-Ala-D-Ala carboxypeptidase